MITIEAKTLRDMFRQVVPHMGEDDYIPVIHSVRLEQRDGWLYAIASDRYTIAVARRPVTNHGECTGHIPGRLVPALTAWLEGHAEFGGSIGVTLPVTKGDVDIILTTPGRGRFDVTYDTEDYKAFPDWRKILHSVLIAQPGIVPLTGVTTRFLNRWEHAAEKLVVWQEAGNKPILLLDEAGEFAGMQMPVSFHRDGMKREDVATSWIAATVKTSVVDGRTYDLDKTWVDRHGDPWTYSGNDMPDGMPLMLLDGIEDDPHPLDRLIWAYGPIEAELTPAA
ncbi:phiSA1p31-related protein [Streptomyces sp. NPDC048663]|uniref:phiSA1p31-related protein n=1 Tax=Streptomyces sp. NPDC048663 TaxID=3155638 RepID=UPI00344795F1